MKERSFVLIQRWLWGFVFCSAVLMGASDPYFVGPSLISVIAGSCVGYGVLCWCVLDARQRGVPIPHGVVLIMLVTWPVSPLGYLLYAKGIRGLGTFFLGCVLIFAGVMFGSAVTMTASSEWRS